MNAEGGRARGIVGEDVGDEVRGIAGEGIGAGIFLTGEEGGGEVFAETGEGGVGVGEFEEADFGVTDGQAESVINGVAMESGESEFFEKSMKWFGAADLIEHTHGRDVERIGESVSDGNRAVMTPVEILGSVETFFSLVVGGNVGNDGAGEE